MTVPSDHKENTIQITNRIYLTLTRQLEFPTSELFSTPTFNTIGVAVVHHRVEHLVVRFRCTVCRFKLFLGVSSFVSISFAVVAFSG